MNTPHMHTQLASIASDDTSPIYHTNSAEKTVLFIKKNCSFEKILMPAEILSKVEGFFVFIHLQDHQRYVLKCLQPDILNQRDIVF